MAEKKKKGMFDDFGNKVRASIGIFRGAQLVHAMQGGKKKPSIAKDEKVTGKGKSTVTRKGKKLANVTKEQLAASGLSLREYMNKYNKTGKRPTATVSKSKGSYAEKMKARKDLAKKQYAANKKKKK